MSMLNFGRRIPTQVKEDIIVNDSASLPNLISTQSADTQELPPKSTPVVSKKQNAFEKPFASKELFTEINLFIPQILAFLICVFIGLATVFLSRIMIGGMIDPLKDQVSEEVFKSLASQANFLTTFITVAVVMLIGLFGIFLLVKWLFFMPRKNRDIVVRIFKTKGIQFTVENIKPSMLVNLSDKKSEVMITDPAKHYDFMNGRPVLCLREEDRTNIALLRDIDTSGKGRDTDSMVVNAVHTGYEIAREQLANRDDKTKIMLILLIIILGAVALTGYMVMGTPNAVIAGVQKLLTPVATAPVAFIGGL